MPQWIHDRAEHILAKNPSMNKSTAFALATQQAHAVGKSPKGYGTSQGRHDAKAKYDTPKDDKKTANPGRLESPKMDKTAAAVMQSAFFDEMRKIASPSVLRALYKLAFELNLGDTFRRASSSLGNLGQASKAVEQSHAFQRALRGAEEAGILTGARRLPKTPAPSAWLRGAAADEDIAKRFALGGHVTPPSVAPPSKFLSSIPAQSGVITRAPAAATIPAAAVA